MRLIVIVEVARFSDSRADAASALAAFLAASFVARSCAETDRADRFCVREESDHKDSISLVPRSKSHQL